MNAHREAARDQRVCAVTGKGGSDWHAHHVLRVQDCRALGIKADDPRNALRVQWYVHLGHHALKPIPLRCLTSENIAFVKEMLGEMAADYLHRHYVGEDPRV